MSIIYKQWKPPGVYLKDIKNFTGYQDVKGACEKAGVPLVRLRGKEYSPLSLAQVYRILKVIRSLQGERYLRSLAQNSSRRK
jgi:hypothetical protein